MAAAVEGEVEITKKITLPSSSVRMYSLFHGGMLRFWWEKRKEKVLKMAIA